ncbi:PREDICTED: uncharacterized protein LOC109228130 [Nicotiana attenuata]|uniref:uncharacterized protein LOC109228130 n=1 Tax=Nicotiana attenuata TaxID=49451 RepID=UPI000905CAB7|nr:PREDICTED: uncharacterized protein LOC109228130 [Nicotiana attenuata]
MRLAPPGEKTKPSNPKPEKDNKRKRVTKPKDPQNKKTSTRRLQKRFSQMGTDSAHDSAGGEENNDEESALAVAMFRDELSQCEAELKKVSDEEKALRLLCSARKNRSLRISEKHWLKLKKLQRKLYIIGQLRGEVDRVRANCHQWKKNMDQLAAEKEAVTAQLASAEAQLRSVEAKGLAQARKIEVLEAELAKARAEAAQANSEAVQPKAEAEKTKAAIDKSIAIYIREAAAVHVELKEASDRGFLVSSDDEDVVSGSGDEKGEEDAPEGEETPENKATKDEEDTPGGVAPKID